MGLSSPSGDNRGTRGSERLSHLPKVAQQEGGIPARPRPELEQESQGSSAISSAPKLSGGPLSAAASSLVEKSLEMWTFILTQVTTAERTMPSQPMEIWEK